MKEIVITERFSVANKPCLYFYKSCSIWICILKLILNIWSYTVKLFNLFVLFSYFNFTKNIEIQK